MLLTKASMHMNCVSEWKIVEKPKINLDYIAKTKAKLQLLMRQNAGIVRNDNDLMKAKEQLLHWKNEVEEQIKTATM